MKPDVERTAGIGPGAGRRRRGRILMAGACAFVGLAVIAILMVIAVFTATAPLELPGAAVSRDAEDALIGRWMDFQQDLRSERPTAPFRVSSQDINAFCAMMPRLHCRVCASIDGGQLHCRFSAPLWTAGKGRYLNGLATVHLSLRKGELRIDVTSCRINGHALPRWVCRQLGRKRLNPEAFWVMEEFNVLPHIKSIEFQGSYLVLTPIRQDEPL